MLIFHPLRKESSNGVYKALKKLQLKYEEIMKKERKKYGELKVRGKGGNSFILTVSFQFEGGSALERSPQMPPWGGVLTDQEISDLTVFIRTLAKPGRN